MTDTMPNPPATPLAWRSTGRAWVPAARGLPLLTIGAIFAMAAFPAALTFGRGGEDFSGALTAAAVIGGAAAGYFVDDPAGETLSASPTSLARRRLLRLSAITLGLVVTVAAIIVLAATSGPAGSLGLDDRAAVLAAVSGIAAGVAGLVHRSGGAAAAPVGALAGPLSALVISSLAFRFPDLPTLASSVQRDRWWIITAVGWATAGWTSRG